MLNRLRKHQHIIGHWAMELIVVFAGVLIALSAQSWAEDRSSKARAEGAEIRIKDELGTSINYSAERVAIHKCLKQRLARIAEGVQIRRTDWDDMRIEEPDLNGLFAFRRIYRIPTRHWVSNEYRSNLQSGALNPLPVERAADLAIAYAAMERQSQINAEEQVLATRLASIQTGMPLSPPERNDLLATLARLDYLNGLMNLISTQNTRMYFELYPDTPEDIQRTRDNWPIILAGYRERYGDCVDGHAVEAIDEALKR